MITNPRDAVSFIGGQTLTAKQRKFASLGNVLTLFTASDLSESERMEIGMMYQKFILEGFLRGLNIPKLLYERHKKEGILHFGFKGGPIPTGNAIQFDRINWRSIGDGARFGEFIKKVGTRLTAKYSPGLPAQHSQKSNYGRYTPAPIRTGPPKRSFSQMEMEKMAHRIANVVAPSTTVNRIFDAIGQFQQSQGIRAPQMLDTSFSPEPPRYKSPFTDQLKAAQLENTYETREEIMAGGGNPISVAQLPPRTGRASGRQGGTLSSFVQQAIGDPNQAPGRPNKVLVFGATGWPGEASEIKENLDAIGVAHDTVNSLDGVDYSQYAGIIFPGGNASFVYNISESEKSRLRNAIKGGLNYLGNCAGAFAAGAAGGHFALTNTVIDYPNGSNYSGYDEVKLWDGTTRSLPMLGGPSLTSAIKNAGGRVLGTYNQWGQEHVGLGSFDYGAGHVILDAFHPSVENAAGTDPDGSDDFIEQALLKALVQGVDPDQIGTNPGTGGTGTGPGPGGGGGVTTTPVNTTTNMYNMGAPSVTPWQGAPMGSGGGGGARRAPSRKTPVAGSLPGDVVQSSFAAALQNVVGASGPMLQGLAGAIQGLKL